MELIIPSALKLKHLKHIAFKCGIASSGTKSVLSQRLLDEISSKTDKHGNTRVLSIDMGIRNLAYCVIDVPTRSKLPRATPQTSELPTIISWERFAVLNAPSKAVPAVKEAFDPASIAKAAYELLSHRLLQTGPLKVLIERQRFRSMGSHHVLEWTLRVNMLESMLYAILHTLRAEGRWQGEVVGIPPGRVGPFWVDEDGSLAPLSLGDDRSFKKLRKSKSSRIKNKGLKIDLVRQWLENGQLLKLGNSDVERTAAAYTKKWDRLPGRTKNRNLAKEGESAATELVKLDDLADCLLQGMAWKEWEQNKRIARKYGIEPLLEDLDL